MEGFFCLRFSARRPRPKSAAFQMLRSAQLFFPPPAPSLLSPSGLGPAPTGTGAIPPPQLTGMLDPPPASSAAGTSLPKNIPHHPKSNGYEDLGGQGSQGEGYSMLALPGITAGCQPGTGGWEVPWVPAGMGPEASGQPGGSQPGMMGTGGVWYPGDDGDAGLHVEPEFQAHPKPRGIQE